MDINFCAQCGKPLTYKVIGDEGEWLSIKVLDY